jgi:hypothetical protein
VATEYDRRHLQRKMRSQFGRRYNESISVENVNRILRCTILVFRNDTGIAKIVMKWMTLVSSQRGELLSLAGAMSP